jgi:hypothetical protein
MEADWHIAFAMSCNGLLQHLAIMQETNAVPEGSGFDKPPVARGEVGGNGQTGNAGGREKEDDQLVYEPVNRQPSQEFHAFLIVYFRMEDGGRSGSVFLTDKFDKGIAGKQVHGGTLPPVREALPVRFYPLQQRFAFRWDGPVQCHCYHCL